MNVHNWVWKSLVGGIVFLTRPVLRLVRGGGLVLFNENLGRVYKKAHLSIPQQIELLSSRGMRIADFEYATKALVSFGYYRLSGYWYPYRVASGTNEFFVPGITFEEVIALYEFDRKLRFVVFDAIERLEVALRFEIAHAIGEAGAFNHRIEDSYTPEFSRQGIDGKSKLDVLLGNMDRESARSSETFTKHHFEKYGRPLPIWKVVEVINFSQLCNLYSGLKQKDRDLIASRFGIKTKSGNGDSGTLANWMANLNHVRNICAHHSRLWNRNIDVQISPKKLIQYPETKHVLIPNAGSLPTLRHGSIACSRIYPTLVVIAKLLKQLECDDSWVERISMLVINELPSRHSIAEMGFPENFATLPIWTARRQFD